MTAPSEFETTPLTGDLSWLEAYAEARKTVRWSTHTCPDDATSRLLLYAGWELEPEPEPELRRVKGWFR